MPRDPEPTRRLLLEAAEKLFARRGLDVPLQDITRAAGQRNTGAIHYHFKNREGLLKAIIEQHAPAVAERRAELLDEARRTPGDLRGYARAVVVPITGLLYGEPADRAYLQLSVALLREPGAPMSRHLGGEDVQAVVDAVAAAHPELPVVALQERVFLLTQMTGMLCASRAAREGHPPPADSIVHTGLLTRDELEAHLVGICTASMLSV